jgi:hypothetical protein
MTFPPLVNELATDAFNLFFCSNYFLDSWSFNTLYGVFFGCCLMSKWRQRNLQKQRERDWLDQSD